MNDIADRVKHILEVEGLTYSQFAEKIGVAASAVSHFVNRRNKPSLDAITGILTAFPTISPDWLLLGVGALTRESGSDAGVPHKAAQLEVLPTLPDEQAERSAADHDKTRRAAAVAKTESPDAGGANRDGYDEGRHEDIHCAGSVASSEPAAYNARPPARAAVAAPLQIISLYSDGTFECYNRRPRRDGDSRQSAEV